VWLRKIRIANQFCYPHTRNRPQKIICRLYVYLFIHSNIRISNGHLVLIPICFVSMILLRLFFRSFSGDCYFVEEIEAAVTIVIQWISRRLCAIAAVLVTWLTWLLLNILIHFIVPGILHYNPQLTSAMLFIL